MPRKDLLHGYRHPFMDATQFATGVGDEPRTLTDLAMSQFSYTLRMKPEWHNKYTDPETRKKWAAEAADQSWKVRIPGGSVDTKLSTKQIRYVMDELAGYAAFRDAHNSCQVSCFERIWESSHVIDDEASAKLMQDISFLRHPGRSMPTGSVNWLLDPYLCPLRYGQTQVSTPDGPTTLKPPRGSYYTPDHYAVSSHFCLLPSIVSISPKSDAVEFRSYINNLHPTHHANLYSSLSTLLARFIPLFEHTLTDLHRNNPLTQRISGCCKYTIWDEPEPPEHSDDEEGWATYEREMRQWSLNRPLQLPDVSSAGYRGGLESRRHKVSLAGREVKIIPSINEISLDPATPFYAGSPWKVEGMRNERITACGIYVASKENITAPSLQFRMAITYPGGFMLGDSGATLRTWGLRDVDPCHQYIGSIPNLEAGFGVVFPNIYQHQFAPFRLADPTKPGHLTCVSFWLVDPDISSNGLLSPKVGNWKSVPSTADVPPQQKEWVAETMDEVIDRQVPMEVVERILESTEGLLDDTEAKRVRQEISDEREEFRKLNDMNYFCVPFDVWGTI
ncbi:hypothetical protein EYR36_007962 [Pleurotus pulmonarius]|nr:hypothetical protein EYR36_007962 [Pleurotus pulmonarius]